MCFLLPYDLSHQNIVFFTPAGFLCSVAAVKCCAISVQLNNIFWSFGISEVKQIDLKIEYH